MPELLASRAKGEIVQLDTADRRGERIAYTKLQRHKVREIFSSDAECDEQMETLSVTLSSYFDIVRRIYAHYSGGARMSPHGFWAMVRDCKLCNKRLTPQKVDIISIRVNVDNQDEEGNAEDVDKLLTPAEFVEALVRMVRKGKAREGGSERGREGGTLFDFTRVPPINPSLNPLTPPRSSSPATT